MHLKYLMILVLYVNIFLKSFNSISKVDVTLIYHHQCHHYCHGFQSNWEVDNVISSSIKREGEIYKHGSDNIVRILFKATLALTLVPHLFLRKRSFQPRAICNTLSSPLSASYRFLTITRPWRFKYFKPYSCTHCHYIFFRKNISV